MAGLDGTITRERFDLVVLSVGQRPAAGTVQLAEMAGLDVNPWGFLQAEPFEPACTKRDGIFLSGAAAGLKDIGESVMFASAASMQAARVIHAAGGSLAREPAPAAPLPDTILQDPPRVLAVICSCGGRLNAVAAPANLCLSLTRLRNGQIKYSNQCSIDTSVGDCSIDPGYVHAALMSLFDNAIDACQQKPECLAHRITFGVHPSNGSICFSVSDTGIGMDEKTQSKLFTRFFSKGRKGTGLGLFIANKIVEQHGGTITVSSIAGRGSRFVIKLPRKVAHVTNPDRALSSCRQYHQ